MPPALIHRLTSPGDLTAATVACGARDAALGTWQDAEVTCPACLRQCTCGPGVALCPACRTYNAAHRGLPTTQPARPKRPTPRLPRTGPLTTEKQLLAWVQKQAVDAGFLVYHTLNSRGSAPGFPDLVFAKAQQPLWMVELKMDNGKLTTTQQKWMDVLHTITKVEAAVWRPQDQAEILAVFSSMF